MIQWFRYLLLPFLILCTFPMFPVKLVAQNPEFPIMDYPGRIVPPKEIKSWYQKANQLALRYPDSARRIFKQGITQSKLQHYHYGIALHMVGLAQCQHDPQAALLLLNQAKIYCLNESDADLRGMYYLLLTKAYNYLEFKDSAISTGYELLKVAQQRPGSNPPEANLSLAYQQLGEGYMNHQKDELLSIYYYGKALDLEMKYKRTNNLGRIYFSLGGAHANLNNLDKSSTEGYRKGLHYLFKALPLLQKDTPILVAAYQNISGIYSNLDLFDSARMYAEKSLNYYSPKASPGLHMQSYYLLGILYLKQNYFSLAIDNLKKGLIIAKDHALQRKIARFSFHLCDAYQKNLQYDTALFYLQQYTELQDSLITEEKVKTIAQLELNYRTAEKDKIIAQKNLQLNEQKNRIKTNKIWIAAGLISSFCLLGWIILFRHNVQLRRIRESEQLKQELLLYQQGEEIRSLNAMIKGEEKERARLGRELHDGIVSQLAAVKLNLNIIQLKYPLPEAREDYDNVLHHLDETALDLRKTAHNLMPGILIEHGLVHALESYCEKTSNFTGIDIRFIYEAMIPRLEPDLELSLYRMVQELVQNIIKHARASRALVQIDFHDPLLILTIEDNGIGIDLTTTGPKGIGLSNLQSRVKALKGHMDIIGSSDRGTSVFLEFDLSLINTSTAS